jgi:hypothetical protein
VTSAERASLLVVRGGMLGAAGGVGRPRRLSFALFAERLNESGERLVTKLDRKAPVSGSGLHPAQTASKTACKHVRAALGTALLGGSRYPSDPRATGGSQGLGRRSTAERARKRLLVAKPPQHHSPDRGRSIGEDVGRGGQRVRSVSVPRVLPVGLWQQRRRREVHFIRRPRSATCTLACERLVSHKTKKKKAVLSYMV